MVWRLLCYRMKRRVQRFTGMRCCRVTLVRMVSGVVTGFSRLALPTRRRDRIAFFASRRLRVAARSWRRSDFMQRALIATVAFLLAAEVQSDPAAEVRCAELGFSKAAEERDTQAFSGFIDPDARFVGQSVARGVDAVMDAWQVFFADGGPRIRWRPQVVEVLADGDLALSRGPYLVTRLDDRGQTRQSWGTFNSVWRRHSDGRWRVVFDAGSPASGPVSEEALALLAGSADCPD